MIDTATVVPPVAKEGLRNSRTAQKTMKATVFHGVDDIRVEEVPRPTPGPGEAVIRVTLTTICGTDLHIVRGEYPVQPGLIIGHEPVGVIAELGPGVTGYKVGERVLVGAITPCGQCAGCLSGHHSQCGHGSGYEAIGGWRFGNTINGAQAEYLLVPYAQANLAKIPDELTDEQVVLLAGIASTGFSGAESGGVKIGDSVVVFAQGPIGLWLRRPRARLQSRHDSGPLSTVCEPRAQEEVELEEDLGVPTRVGELLGAGLGSILVTSS